MKTNHQMNYYDYGKTLDAQGVMPVINGGVVNPGIESIYMYSDIYGSMGSQSYQALVYDGIYIGNEVVIMLSQKLPEAYSLQNMVVNDEGNNKTIVQSFEYVEDDPFSSGFDFGLEIDNGYLYLGTISNTVSGYSSKFEFTVDIADATGTIKTLNGFMDGYYPGS